MKKILEKYLLLKYIIYSFVKTFLFSLLTVGVIFAVLILTDIYYKIESRLDLKYNSPWILAPVVIAAVLAAVSFIVGLIMYLYKYKRSISKSEFYKALSGLMEDGKNH